MARYDYLTASADPRNRSFLVSYTVLGMGDGEDSEVYYAPDADAARKLAEAELPKRYDKLGYTIRIDLVEDTGTDSVAPEGTDARQWELAGLIASAWYKLSEAQEARGKAYRSWKYWAGRAKGGNKERDQWGAYELALAVERKAEKAYDAVAKAMGNYRASR